MSRSQNEAVLARLRRGPLTQLQALSELGCLRLAGRIFELRLLGNRIEQHLIRLPSGKHIARYTLVRLAHA